MARKKKITKTAREYNRIYHAIKEQERYYRNKGIKLPEISAADFGGKTRSGLAALKRYQKQLKQTVADIKKEIKDIRKEAGVSTSAAYEIASGRRAAADVTYQQVAIDNFYQIVASWATRSSRETMYKFLNEIRSRVTDSDFAAVLQQTAQEGGAMEELQFYHSYGEETALVQPLIYSMLSKFSSIGNLTRDEMNDRLDQWFSAFETKGRYVKGAKL